MIPVYRNILVLLGLVGMFEAAEPAKAQSEFPQHVHDPCIIRQQDKYFLFSTGGGIMIRRSDDLLKWRNAGHVFEAIPGWAKKRIPGVESLWAPDISHFNGEYHLYYSVSTFGSKHSCIGLATNKTLDSSDNSYRWQDHGKVIESSDHNDWNAIDPNIVFDEHNTPWLSFGSFNSGIKMCEIDAKTGMPANGPPRLLDLARRPQAEAIEAPFVVRRGHQYYLFVSFDHCCQGVDSDYKIMVGRANRVIGPYVDRKGRPMLQGGGTLVLAGKGRVRGPGHNAVLNDNGKYLLIHHFYDAKYDGIPSLQIRPLTWDKEGWPLAGEPLSRPINDGTTAKLTENEKPGSPTPAHVRLTKEQVAGRWKHVVGSEPREIALLPSGKINREVGKATWSIEGLRLILTWPSKDAPGGAWIDRCELASDGKSYRGKNQDGIEIRGKRIE